VRSATVCEVVDVGVGGVVIAWGTEIEDVSPIEVTCAVVVAVVAIVVLLFRIAYSLS
jgi:hypothetical protein